MEAPLAPAPSTAILVIIDLPVIRPLRRNAWHDTAEAYIHGLLAPDHRR
jgi:hypothetical protein